MSRGFEYYCSVTEANFKDAMSKIPTNVSVLGSWEVANIKACTISSLVSVDIIDPTIMFVLKNGSANLINLKRTIDFSINVLTAKQSVFSEIYSNSPVKFEDLSINNFWCTHASGVPIIPNAHLTFICKFNSCLALENATLVFAKVVEVIAGENSNPLVYFQRMYYQVKDIN